MATVAVVGATGGIGSHVVEQALAAGHMVHALARDPSKVPPTKGLTVHQGDARDPASLTPLLDADIILFRNPFPLIAAELPGCRTHAHMIQRTSLRTSPRALLTRRAAPGAATRRTSSATRAPAGWRPTAGRSTRAAPRRAGRCARARSQRDPTRESSRGRPTPSLPTRAHTHASVDSQLARRSLRLTGARDLARV